MITAVDTSVLLDVFRADPTFGARSRSGLERCIDEGRLIACDVVWAETASVFRSNDKARAALERLGVEFVATALDAAEVASDAWRAYRSRGGKRQRVAADFLVGAHALVHAQRLLTRDRGFYRTYFRRLRVLDPSTGE